MAKAVALAVLLDRFQGTTYSQAPAGACFFSEARDTKL